MQKGHSPTTQKKVRKKHNKRFFWLQQLFHEKTTRKQLTACFTAELLGRRGNNKKEKRE